MDTRDYDNSVNNTVNNGVKNSVNGENNIINTAAENFSAFLKDKDWRQYYDRLKGDNYYFFKLSYDDDCDFIHIIEVYGSLYNNNGKPGLNDRSRLCGIYVYSLDLLFNTEYDLQNFLARTDNKDILKYETTSVQDYYKQLNKDISAEVIKRIEAGAFDREEAESVINKDDGDIKYYKEYRQRDCAVRDFLDGKRKDKPEICISYETRCEYEIPAVLEYLRYPAEIINSRATAFMETEKVRIYKAIFRAEVEFESFKEIERDKSNPLHYQREVRRVIKAACVKTVNITLERGGKSVTVKIQADRLGWNNSLSDWDIVSADRYAYNKLFGYNLGGDAKMDEITLITHGKKELYNKTAFEKTLLEDKII